MPRSGSKKIIIVLAIAILIGIFLFCEFSFSSVHYKKTGTVAAAQLAIQVPAAAKVASSSVVHVPTPASVKAIYMTSWVAGTPSLRNKLVNVLETTGANSVVIDIKDYSGTISFPVTDNPALAAYGSVSVRVRDLPQFIALLHRKGIYVIGRIAVFQDAYFVKYRPDLAVQNASSTSVWADQKGISWIDPGARDYWKYIAMIGDESYSIGFDELNFDYIRYPSDGDLKDISYPWTKNDQKADVIKNFFAFLHNHFAPEHVTISADLFGETTTAPDDMGIGQVLANAFPYFDYIAPMVYPSHYAAGFDGFQNPAAHPYEIVSYAMNSAVARAKTASTSPLKLRPWLQDFNLGASYGPAQVEAEEKAVTDAGLNSWMMWNANNVYTTEALGSK